YYKRQNKISEESWYKQFTYARNVIQWNLDLFLSGKNDTDDVLLRDDTTEGYNIIPNFFISATMDDDLSYKTDIYPTEREKKFHFSRQFENRLFDRDSLLVCHYDVNFLYIIALYARCNKSQQAAWKVKVRDMFREEIQKMLVEKYQFYVMTPRAGVNASAYIEEHFQQLLGKVFTPYENNGTQRYYSLALSTNKEFQDENDTIVSQLETSFHVRKCKIGDNPRVALADVLQEAPLPIQTTPNFLTLHYLEKYMDKSILVGYYKDEKHLQWILGNNDRGTLLYNVRLGKNVKGGFIKAQLDKMVVSFVILYEYGHAHENKYRVFRVHHHATMTAERLKRSLYPSEPTAEKYLCYVFDEEVTLGNIDISRLIKEEIKKDMVQIPVFKTGKDLLPYRKT
ncbi:MAG: restriction endonuclease, partial [Veillonella sp.]|nr:restriction endonuclease [Veillonella sp.]